MAYYSFILFYLLFFYLFLEIKSFTPTGRLAHSTVLVGKKLYFFGGAVNSNHCSNEVFYLDLSKSFNMKVPSWNDLTSNAGIPFKSCWGTASWINTYQTVYLFGGIMDDIITNNDNFVSVIYSFNLNSLTWKIPTIKGISTVRRCQVQSVIDNTEKIYIFGGSNLGLVPNVTFFNQTIILDTLTSSWFSSTIGSPNSRVEYTATLLRNGIIVYIGGFENNIISSKLVEINQISRYDTKSSTWLAVMTTKLTDRIDNRRSHKAVLTPDGKIIVHGGGMIDIVGNGNVQVTPDLAVLDTNKEPYEWTIPSVFSNVGPVPSLVAHSADLVGNYMVAAFGNITQKNANPLEINSKVYLLDIRNYTWVDTFETPEPEEPKPTPLPPKGLTANPDLHDQIKKLEIGIGVIGGILAAVAFVLFGRYCRSLYRQRQTNSTFIRDVISDTRASHDDC